MSPLHRLTILPLSPWRTPWHADTLAGALLATCARVHGSDFLRAKLIDPMLTGDPPFVLSDALPGDLLPFPTHLRLRRYPDGASLKHIKRARWLTPDAFRSARAGATPPIHALVPRDKIFLDSARHHNTLSRLTDTSTAEDADEKSAIGLFQKADTLLAAGSDCSHLTLYFRFIDRAAGGLLLDLLHELSLTGFGADTSTGRGQFDLPGDPAPAPEFDTPPDGADALLSLSTFQPAPHDPADGYWEAFPKFGKLGPDLGLADVHKHTLILFRPGAVFRTDPRTQFLGYAVDTPLLFPTDVARSLHERDLRVIHPVFGLMVPLTAGNNL